MKIKFESGDDSYFAISENAFWRGLMYEELLWAEVKPSGNKYVVVWEDAWNKLIKFDSIDEARQHVEQNFKNHKPHINGKEYNMEDEQ